MVLTNLPRDPLLDLDPWVGQRSCTFKFHVVDAVSGDEMGEIHPIRGATLSHDTGRTIKRDLNISLGTADTAAINPLRERIRVTMVFANGATYPLGRYMFTNDNKKKYTSGKLGSEILNDEMFLIDQQIRKGIDGTLGSVSDVIGKVLSGLPITYNIEPSNFSAREVWPIGTNRGSILESLAISGDFFSPWMDNDGVFRMIRTFNPVDRIPDIDLDNGNRVLRESIEEDNDLLTAPNVFIVTSNISGTNGQQEIVGVAQVPVTAPNSVANRGFEIVDSRTLQLSSPGQAQAVANGIAQRQTVYERVTLTTPPDPRHDSYNVIHWDNAQWLELSWSMALVEGGTMNHLLRKAYQ